MQWEGPVRTWMVLVEGLRSFPLVPQLETIVVVPKCPPGFSPVLLVLVEDTYRPLTPSSGGNGPHSTTS